MELEEGAVRFIVEPFVPARQLQRCADWQPTQENPVIVIDLNGHFTTAVGCTIDGEHLLVNFNTTNGNYLHGEAPLAAFELGVMAAEHSINN